MTRTALPGAEAFAQIAQAIGGEAAFALAKRYGGTTQYVPREIGPEHHLWQQLGIDAATKLAEYYGGTRLSVPKGAQRRSWVRQLARGRALTITAIAMETGYSERQVYRILSEGDSEERHPDLVDDRQLDLF
ncbi:MAG: hypothetical protein NTX28_06315 [Novosphingobium sp.]|nr:hypothetical protein [Novosphingobium sp.]